MWAEDSEDASIRPMSLDVSRQEDLLQNFEKSERGFNGALNNTDTTYRHSGQVESMPTVERELPVYNEDPYEVSPYENN